MTRPPVALTIAGSDPSGGAGLQGDIKTFSALGAYGTAVATALTAQSTRGVTAIHHVPAEFVTAQLQTLVLDVRIDAVKIGMLATQDVIEVVEAYLRDASQDVVVLDPVMVATSGDRLLDPGAIGALRTLLPLVSLLTPNLHEAALLLGCEAAVDVEQMQEQAQRLLAAGARRVLLKGGHLTATASAVDVYASAEQVRTLDASRVPTSHTHGTGCALSSAIAALRPQRATWLEAVIDAKDWVTGAISAASTLEVGSGHGPVHHLHRAWRNR